MLAVIKHELSSYFNNLMGYVFGAFLLLFTGIFVLAYNLSYYYASFVYALSAVSFIFLVIVPILTMRVLAEERRQKTDQLLYSLPITMTEVVLGKFLAMLVVLAIPVCIICLYPLVLSAYGDIYLPQTYGAIAGFFFLGAALIAVGTYISSLTENQAVSAGLCFVVMLINYYIADLAGYISSMAAVSLVAISLTVILVAVLVRLITKNTTVALATAVVLEGITLAVYLIDNSLFQGLFPNILQSLSLYQRFYTLLSGVLDLGSFVYYISVIVVMLFMSVQSMEKRRWSE